MSFLPSIRKQVVIQNTFYNIVAYGCKMALGLFLTPYIIRSLGIERFGIWAVAAIITGYLGLFDFGIGLSFTKYLSEFYAKSQLEKMSEIISTGFLLYFLFTGLITLLFLLFKEPLLSFFTITPSLHSEALITFFISIFVFGIAACLNAFGIIPVAMQRFDIVNIVSVAFSFLNAGCIIFILKHGYGLVGLAASTALVVVMRQGVDIGIAYILIPGLRFRPLSFNWEIFLKLFRFGFSMQIAKVSGWISTQVDKVLIGAFLSLGMVTYYELGSTIVNYALGISALFVSALLPAFSHIRSRESHEQLIGAYLTALRYGICLILPLFIFIAISGSFIMKAWMGNLYGWVGNLVTILCLAFLVNAIAQIPASMCMAIDRPDFLSVGSFIIITLNIGLSFLFVKIFGFWGVAWGTAIAVNVGTLYFLFMLHKDIAIGFPRFLKILTPFTAASVMALAAVFLFELFVPATSLPLFYGLLIRGVIFFGFYTLIIWKQKMLHRENG